MLNAWKPRILSISPLLYVHTFAHMNVNLLFGEKIVISSKKKEGKFWKICLSNTNSTNFAIFLEQLAKYHLISQICEICSTFVNF
jgi:hypothetical protein